MPTIRHESAQLRRNKILIYHYFGKRDTIFNRINPLMVYSSERLLAFAFLSRHHLAPFAPVLAAVRDRCLPFEAFIDHVTFTTQMRGEIECWERADRRDTDSGEVGSARWERPRAWP